MGKRCARVWPANPTSHGKWIVARGPFRRACALCFRAQLCFECGGSVRPSRRRARLEEAAFDDRQWGVEVALARQDAWGPLATRSIPFMSGDAVPMLTAPSVRPLLKPQEWHSFSSPLRTSSRTTARSTRSGCISRVGSIRPGRDRPGERALWRALFERKAGAQADHVRHTASACQPALGTAQGLEPSVR